MVALMSACCCEKIETREILMDLDYTSLVRPSFTHYDVGISASIFGNFFPGYGLSVLLVSRSSREYSSYQGPSRINLGFFSGSSLKQIFKDERHFIHFPDGSYDYDILLCMYFLDENFRNVFRNFCSKFDSIFASFLDDALVCFDSDEFTESGKEVYKKFNLKYTYSYHFNYSVRVRVHYKDVKLGLTYQLVDFEVLEIIRPCVMDLIKK